VRYKEGAKRDVRKKTSVKSSNEIRHSKRARVAALFSRFFRDFIGKSNRSQFEEEERNQTLSNVCAVSFRK
jgi:hypothetical protein